MKEKRLVVACLSCPLLLHWTGCFVASAAAGQGAAVSCFGLDGR